MELSKILNNYVLKRDIEIFSSETDLIFYWIVERHPTKRCMQQFNFKQSPNPPFEKPYDRFERSVHSDANYRYKMSEHINNWNARRENILTGGPRDNLINEEYFLWYHKITRLRIGRPEEGKTPPPIDRILHQDGEDMHQEGENQGEEKANVSRKSSAQVTCT